MIPYLLTRRRRLKPAWEVAWDDSTHYTENPDRAYWWSDKAWEAILPFMRINDWDLEYGPGHIVFADGNTDDSCIEHCMTPEFNEASRFEGERLEFVYSALRALKSIPEDERRRDDYDDRRDERWTI